MIGYLSVVLLVLHQIYAAPHDQDLSKRGQSFQHQGSVSNTKMGNVMVMNNPHNGQAMVMNPSGPNPVMMMGSGSGQAMASGASSSNTMMVNVHPPAAAGSVQSSGNHNFQVQGSFNNQNPSGGSYVQYSRPDTNPRVRLYNQQWGIGSASSLARNSELNLLDSIISSFNSIKFPISSESYWAGFPFRSNQNTMISSGNGGVMVMNSVRTK